MAATPAPGGLSPVRLHRYLLHRQAGKPQRIAEPAGCLFEIENALRVRRLVDAIHARNRVLLNPGRHALVRAQHELLDQPVRPTAFGPHNRLHVPIRIELNHRLRQIEIDATSSVTFCIQLQRQFVHSLKTGYKFLKLRAHRPVRIRRCIRPAIQDRLHLGIRHPPRAANHPLAHLVPHHLAAPVDLHHAAQHQPVLVRAQAAHATGKLWRQHRHRAVGKVDAGPTQPRFQVQRCPRPHIVAHVRNVDLQLPVAILQRRHQYRVVEVPRRLAIDGDNRQPAKIPPPRPLVRRQRLHRLRRRCARLRQHIRGKHVRQMMLADDDLHVHPERVRRSQHLNHAPLRRPSRSRKVRDLHIHRQALQPVVPSRKLRRVLRGRPSPLLRVRLFAQDPVRRFHRRRRRLRALGNQDRPATRSTRHPLIQRRHIIPRDHRRIIPRAPASAVASPPPRVVEDPHHGCIPPRQYPRNPSRPPAVAPRRGLVHQHLVALHRAIQFIRRNKQIVVAIAAPIGPHKAVPIPVQVQLPGHQPVPCRP